jgi:predicted 2-oxoglutarate/Fe(II)-dependent dioxygenase YbiX
LSDLLGRFQHYSGATQALSVRHRGREAEVIRLTGLYHNLLRKWGEL